MSFCPTLVTNDHHWNDGKWFRDKQPIDSVGKTLANDASRFSGGDLFITFRPYIACRLSIYQKVEKIANLFFTKSVRVGFGKLSIGAICSKSRDLAI